VDTDACLDFNENKLLWFKLPKLQLMLKKNWDFYWARSQEGLFGKVHSNNSPTSFHPLTCLCLNEKWYRPRLATANQDRVP